MHATICDIITDLVQNSMEAQASEISITIEETEQMIRGMIKDNGKGMSSTVLEKAKDPFYTDGEKHKQRKVGLGLPFLYQTAEMTGGTAEVKSQEQVGTTVSFQFDQTHVDLPEFGDFTNAAVMMMTFGDGDLIINRKREDDQYTISRSELSEVLGDLNDLENLALLKNYIDSQEIDLRKAK